MIHALTPRQRRLLALAILTLVLVVIFTLAVAPLWALNRHYVDRIDGLERRLEVLQRTVAAGSGLRVQHEQLKQALAGDRHYLKSNTEALAAADLQGIIKRVAGTSGMDVLSTQILPAIDESDFTGIVLKVRMQGSLENLVKVFHTLEAGQPYLFLDNVSIRSSGVRRRQSNRTVNTAQMLQVDFDLIGYMSRKS